MQHATTQEAVVLDQIWGDLPARPQPHCTDCGKGSLVREKRPLYLRPLRLFGVNIRAYRCNRCDRRVLTRHRWKG